MDEAACPVKKSNFNPKQAVMVRLCIIMMYIDQLIVTCTAITVSLSEILVNMHATHVLRLWGNEIAEEV